MTKYSGYMAQGLLEVFFHLDTMMSGDQNAWASEVKRRGLKVIFVPCLVDGYNRVVAAPAVGWDIGKVAMVPSAHPEGTRID